MDFEVLQTLNFTKLVASNFYAVGKKSNRKAIESNNVTSVVVSKINIKRLEKKVYGFQIKVYINFI